MKKVLFILIALFVVTSTFAETTDTPRPRPRHSSGFNYAKHYRKQRHHERMNRLFDRDHCNHYRKFGY